jgi:hypothetical protein
MAADNPSCSIRMSAWCSVFVERDDQRGKQSPNSWDGLGVASYWLSHHERMGSMHDFVTAILMDGIDAVSGTAARPYPS